MAVNPMMIGVNGIQSALKGMNHAAQEVAELNVDQGDGADTAPEPKGLDEMAEALIDLKIYSRQVQANAKVVQTADEMIGFLLDVVA